MDRISAEESERREKRKMEKNTKKRRIAMID